MLRILDESLADAPSLVDNRYLIDNRYTIADMACFAYTHLAEDADLPLREYRNVVEWIKRVREQPGFLAKVHPYSIDPHSVKELP